MDAEFYDVKERKKVKAPVIEKVTYANGRHAFKAKTKDGRSLMRFVSADEYAKADVPCAKGGAKAKKPAAKKAAAKKK